jgi:hypothetical protein
MSLDKLPAAIWESARFLHADRRPDFLDVTHPDEILKAARVEIDAEISAMLRGHKSDIVESLCCGAIAVRRDAVLAKEWHVATSLLRSPCATRAYNSAHDWVEQNIVPIRRVARSLAGSGRLSAAQALWIADAPARHAA